MKENNYAKFFVFELRLEIDCTSRKYQKEILGKYSHNENLSDLKSAKKLIEEIFEAKNGIEHKTDTISRELVEHKIFKDKDDHITAYAALIKYKNFNLRISDLENKVGTLRDLKQAVDEAPSLRSHIVFKFIKDPNSEEYRTFVALEQSTGINITAVTSLLQNHTKNKEKKITIRDTSKEIKPNKITFFSHVKYISPSSETLEQIIKNGQLSRVKVVTSSYKSDDNESTPVKRYKETSDIIQFPKGYKHVEKAISKVKGLLCDKVDENAEKILYVTIKDKYTNTDEFDAKKDRDINDIKNLFCHKQEYLPFQNGIIEPTYKKVKDDIVNKVLDKVISDEKLKTYIETI